MARSLVKLKVAARWAGLLWIIAVGASGAILVAQGLLHLNRATMVMLFCAMLPGVLAMRWSRQGVDYIPPSIERAGRTRR